MKYPKFNKINGDVNVNNNKKSRSSVDPTMIMLMKTMTTNIPTELKSNGLLFQQQQLTAATSAATFIADTALPSDLGLNLRLRAYRTDVPSENGYIGITKY
jgi:hypothetical protein